jgi:hypothetical protein
MQQILFFPAFTNDYTMQNIIGTMIVILVQNPLDFEYISQILILVLANINVLLTAVEEPGESEFGELE